MAGPVEPRESALNSPLTTQRIQVEDALHEMSSAHGGNAVVFGALVEGEGETFVRRMWRDHTQTWESYRDHPSLQWRKEGSIYQGILRELTTTFVTRAAERLVIATGPRDPQPRVHADLRDLRTHVQGHDIAIAKLKRDLEALAEVVVSTRARAEGGLDAIDALAADFELTEPGRVARHLSKKRRDLPEALRDTARELHRRFGAVKLALDAREEDRLVLTVGLPADLADVRGAITSFRREWWISTFSGDDGVTFDPEFA